MLTLQENISDIVKCLQLIVSHNINVTQMSDFLHQSKYLIKYLCFDMKFNCTDKICFIRKHWSGSEI